MFGLLGDALMEQGRYEEAGVAYRRMFDLGPNLFSYNRLGYHRFVTGKPAEAIQWMSQAVDAGAGGEPEHLAWCLVEYADMLFKTGKTEQAIAAYSQSLKAFPKYHRARAALGMAKAAVGNTADAIRLLTEAENTVPYPEYAAALADLYRLTGNGTEAERQSKRVDAMVKIARGEKRPTASSRSFTRAKAETFPKLSNWQTPSLRCATTFTHLMHLPGRCIKTASSQKHNRRVRRLCS